MTRRWAVPAVFAVLVAACGGGDDEAATQESSPPPTSVESATSLVTTTSSTTTTAACTVDALADGTVSTVGFDDITFGMTVAAAEETSGVCLEADRPPNQECYYVVPLPGPAGVSFLVTDGTIERIDVFGGDVTTRSGLGLGSSEAEVIDRFGDSLTVGPHPQGGGNELVFVPRDEGDSAFRVVFETNGERVIRFRSGRVPQVEESLPCGGPTEVTDTVEPAVSPG